MAVISHLIGVNKEVFFLQRKTIPFLFSSMEKQKLFSGRIIDIFKYQL
jgi:hypothetical protein